MKDMQTYKEYAQRNEDFEALKQLANDLKDVFNLGKEIWKAKRELNFAVAKEDFSKAIELRDKIRRLEHKRDSYDALYETSRYEHMVVMNRPSTADYLK